MTNYRSEIDGLRAIAVLPVMFFHAGLPGFSGGFVGVDVFFVISGYLITTIIHQEIERGSFSLTQFYERRARRILPALFFVIAACIPFCALWLYYDDLRSFGASIVAAVVFASNIYFWRQSGYFDSSAELKPLLHTWSLGVEEQFYLLFPLLLLSVRKLSKEKLAISLFVIAASSLGLAHWLSLSRPNIAFYLLPARAWELLAGALTALLLSENATTKVDRRVRELVGLVGIAAIIFAYFAFSKGTPTPGLHFLVPIIGTIAILAFSHHDTLVARWLGSAPFRVVGLMSFSAYLWHQPVLALVRHRSTETVGMSASLAACVVTLMLAWLTWRFVETPVRTRQWLPTKADLWRFVVVGSVSLTILGGVLIKLAGTDPENPTVKENCSADKPDCTLIPSASIRVALWGDSFAQAISRDLGSELNKNNISMLDLTKPSCPSLLGVRRNEAARLGQSFASECDLHNRRAVASIRDNKVNVVVLTSAYQWYVTTTNDLGQPILLDGDHADAAPRHFIGRRLAATIATIKAAGAEVVVLSPHPVVKEFDAARRRYRFGATNQIEADLETATEVRRILLEALPRPNDILAEVDGRSLLCNDQRCPVVDSSGNILLYDGSHLGVTLAKLAAQKVYFASTAHLRKE